MDRWLSQALELMDEIQWTARALAELRHSLVRDFGLDRRRWAVLLAISRSHYTLSISDLARALKQTRQSTHRMAVAMARSGWLELLPNRDDRRLLQIALTRGGKSVVAQIRQRYRMSVLTFCATLDTREMRATAELLKLVRQEMAELKSSSLASPRGFEPRLLP
jgi:DNA-binding MarR family transcriptional regulator